jgi:phage N-6-adenine-methyltransferase
MAEAVKNKTVGESPDVVHGRLMEALHIGGYELTRGLVHFDWLIDKDRWRSLGNGFDDIDVFIESLKLSTFKLTLEQRQSIVKKLASIRGKDQKKASQRAIAKAVGVDEKTIRRDLDPPAANAAKSIIGSKQNQEVTDASAANAAKPPAAITQSGEEVAKAAEKAAASPHVAKNSGENEWYTPPEYIEAARKVMGSIDLDPASSEKANEIVQATVYYTKEDSGLDKPWSKRVWLNPPYAAELIRLFTSKFAGHVKSGEITEGIVITNNATETEWFEELVEISSAMAFPRKRVKFLDPEGKPGAPLQG